MQLSCQLLPAASQNNYWSDHPKCEGIIGIKEYFSRGGVLQIFQIQNGQLVKSEYQNNIFLFLNQNICCGYSKEPSEWEGSFEHPKHMLKLMGKKIFKI